MSSPDLARRVALTVAFDGVDITKQMTPYLLSLTFTDNESDEADDLQIKIHDRDGVWIEKWLNDALDAAVTSVPADTGASAQTTTRYRVTPKIGLNVRVGRGTGSAKLGALSCGTEIDVYDITDGWAKIRYKDKDAYVCASYLAETGEKKADASSNAASTAGSAKPKLTIEALMTAQNWNGDGKDAVLDCGMFELDSVKVSGPPATITIKATSLPYAATIRQTKKNKAWEAYTLSGIANEIAAANGMTCLFSSANDPYYARTEQFGESDIAFLARLCKNVGLSIKATSKILVLFDQRTYEGKTAVRKFVKGDGSYTKYDFSIGTADAQYQSCRVRYTPPNGKVIEGIAYVADYKADNKNNQQLEITAKVADIGEAKALAEKRLRLHNKYYKTCEITVPFDATLVAGETIEVFGWGSFDGKYIVKKAVHAAGGSGSTTKISARRVLEGY